ncbi:MAG: dipeptide ABC transporter ATP-binding protein [Streptosporangiales bacterium]|nr:dipeptide ABC transporter ATP-binding protein [Streptosporangiales bacterium]
MSDDEPILRIEGLSVVYRTREDVTHAVRGVDLDLKRGETLGLVGESGSGKTSVAFAILRYLGGAAVVEGRILFKGQDLLTAGPDELSRLRGKEIGMVYQSPGTALNPTMTVGRQISEVLRIHHLADRKTARMRAEDMLRLSGIPDPNVTVKRYPHQLSGGMKQRVVIAMALVANPSLLILDEPTTALDVTTEARILDLINEIGRTRDLAILLITHDLGVVASRADRMAVMMQGELVESGRVADLYARPKHEYTQSLLAAARGPVRVEADETPRDLGDDVMATSSVRVEFRGIGRAPLTGGRSRVHAVEGVSLNIRQGETVGLVGESGSGKTTLGKTLLRLHTPTGGTVLFRGRDVGALSRYEVKNMRREVQFIFQDPASSLNPRRTVGELIARPLKLYGVVSGRDAIRKEVARLLDLVNLSSDYASRLPSELSGGQQQRVAIARAFGARPEMIIADEPTASLDVSVAARILDLLRSLQREFNVAYLVISHDMRVVRSLCDRVMVMYLGVLCESGRASEVFEPPYHPYTEALLSSVPLADPNVEAEPVRLTGSVASPMNPPPGCRFHTRCPRKLGAVCEETVPVEREVTPGHVVWCHLPDEGLRRDSVYKQV